MSDATVIDTEPEVVSQLPADVAPPAPADSWDSVQSLLDEFDRQTATPEHDSATEQGDGENGAATGDELDKILADLGGPTADQKRIGELEGEIGSLRAAELDRKSRADFEGFAAKLQKTLGSNVDDSYARTNLLAAVTERPELGIVWQHRHVTDAQLRMAEQEFQQLEVLHMRVQQAPDDPRKQQAVAALEQRGYQLGLMLNARKILDGVWRDVQKKASKVLPMIDPDLSQIRDDVAWAVKSASAKAPPEPPVNFGRMTDKEFKEYTRISYGF